MTTARCQNGNWDNQLGQCVSLNSGLNSGFNNNFGNGMSGMSGLGGQCMSMPKPLNGRIMYSNLLTSSSYPTGTIATLICDSGYSWFLNFYII